MECPSCDSKKPMKTEIIVHRFKESGLDNIILHGVKSQRCTKCGEVFYDFGDVNQLNRLIADTLLRKQGTLTGPEIRFLRTHIGYSSEMFSKMLGYDKTSWSRIENERSKISNQVNMSVRFAVAGKLADKDYDLHDLYEALENEDLLKFDKPEFKKTTNGEWQFQKSA